MLWPKMDASFVTSGGGNGRPAYDGAAERQMVLVAEGVASGAGMRRSIGYCRPSVSDQRGRGEGDAGVRSIGTAVVDVTPDDYFELIARQTSERRGQ